MTMQKLIATRPEMAQAVTAETVALESYYNLCRLQELTHFADPIAAVRALRLRLHVRRDPFGNIVALQP